MSIHEDPRRRIRLCHAEGAATGAAATHGTRSTMGRLLLIILCFFFPFVAVLIHEGPSIKVLWAFLLQLVAHIPGVIYGIWVVTRD
jgi:uncharacterized membrane protein YqaE (UPF0057 family)